MVPTPKLRFVEREVYKGINGGGQHVYNTVRVLQQWWNWSIDYPTASGEWRDVPLEVQHDGA